MGSSALEPSLAYYVQQTDTKRAWIFFPPNGVMKKTWRSKNTLGTGMPWWVGITSVIWPKIPWQKNVTFPVAVAESPRPKATPSGLGFPCLALRDGAWWGRGGVVVFLFLLKKKPFCVWGTNHFGRVSELYIGFNFSSSYIKEDSNMDQKPVTYLFLDHHQALTMYIHIPSGPFLDDHASRIKEDEF